MAFALVPRPVPFTSGGPAWLLPSQLSFQDVLHGYLPTQHVGHLLDQT